MRIREDKQLEKEVTLDFENGMFNGMYDFQVHKRELFTVRVIVLDSRTRWRLEIYLGSWLSVELKA